MEREIKFRVWSKTKNNWVQNMLLLACIDGLPFVHLVEVDEKGEFKAHHVYNASSLELTVQQYTGLKDKTGKEIYEGDIILRECVNLKCECIWSDEEASYILRYIDNTFIYLADFSGIEVIGNIMEYPEILDYTEGILRHWNN